MEINKINNKVFLIGYHIVFCPKRRKPVLVGKIKKRLIEIFNEVAEEKKFKILKLAINPDHLHLFVQAYPTIQPHKIVKTFKGKSSCYLRKEFPELLKLPSLWTRSYFISTIGNVSEKTIERYIEEQKGK